MKGCCIFVCAIAFLGVLLGPYRAWGVLAASAAPLQVAELCKAEHARCLAAGARLEAAWQDGSLAAWRAAAARAATAGAEAAHEAAAAAARAAARAGWAVADYSDAYSDALANARVQNSSFCCCCC